jgi:hypothetical protein
MEFPVDEFLSQQEHELAGRIKTYQAMSNNVSAIGHDCVRYLVYKRTRGDEASPISTELQALFDEGNAQEVSTASRIAELGYKYERGQESFGFKDLEIRGKLDGVVMKVSGGKIVGKWACEIKKVNGYMWEKINIWEDLLENWWQRKWVTQLQLAIFHVASKEGFDDTGVFFLKNTEKNLIKPLAMPMDEKIIDAAFEKARQVNLHMKAGTVPDRCDYTLGICKTCEFNAICCPDENFLAGENITDPEFIESLKRHEMLAQSSKEYARLHDFIKEVLRGKVYAVAGPFRISGKESGRGWKMEIERVFSDNDVEKINAAIDISQAKNPEENPNEHTNVGRMDFQLFLRNIRESTTLDELNGVRKEFQEAHAKEPFTGKDLDEIRRVFKEQYVKKGMK